MPYAEVHQSKTIQCLRGIHISLIVVFSLQSTKGICLYCSSILLTLFPAWCIKDNSENIGLEM